MRESGVVTTEQKQVALANLRVTTSKSVLPAFYFLWTSGFYVRTTKIYKVLVRWISEVKKQFFILVIILFFTRTIKPNLLLKGLLGSNLCLLFIEQINIV